MGGRGEDIETDVLSNHFMCMVCPRAVGHTGFGGSQRKCPIHLGVGIREGFWGVRDTGLSESSIRQRYVLRGKD